MVRPTRWVDTLIATAEHDDVFNELESAPLLTPSGGPMDFKMNNFDRNLSQRLIDRAEMKGSFIALLVFRHICFTHGDDPKSNIMIFKNGHILLLSVNKIQIINDINN